MENLVIELAEISQSIPYLEVLPLVIVATALLLTGNMFKNW